MSIDYSDMAFPKYGKKKKKKKHKKSILQTEKGVCFLCKHLNKDESLKYTEEHHILFGSGQRSKAEAEGLKVFLCRHHHRNSKDAVHENKEIREILGRIAQTEYEKTHTREEWNSISKKNYL